MSLDRKHLDSLLKRVESLADSYRAQLRKSMPGVPFGHQHPSNEEFLAFFHAMAVGMLDETGKFSPGNPNWVLALQYADGGKEILERYHHLTGIDPVRGIAVFSKMHFEMARSAMEAGPKVETPQLGEV